MFRNILIFGVIGGLVAGTPMVLMTALSGGKTLFEGGMVLGYAIMLVAFSTIFIAIKRQRDVNGGGVIKFWPAFGMGLAITAIATLFYSAAWELSQALSQMDFPTAYGAAMIEKLKAQGATPEKIAAATRQMQDFAVQYRNPFYRIPMTMLEIFPVGVLISLVSAIALRFSRFLPARTAAA